MKKGSRKDILRLIPPVNKLLENIEVNTLIENYGRLQVTENIRLLIKEFRMNTEKFTDVAEENISVNAEDNSQRSFNGLSKRDDITKYLIKELAQLTYNQQIPSLRKVINATGIVLHTNLGRAPLPGSVLHNLEEISSGYSNLEFDINKGSRGSRHSHIESLITKLTGAESAVLVNNNAAAVFLSLNTLADKGEVIVSRGQQVEIGGSFRIPEIIEGSGAKMIEVGTTNKTRITDYSAAVSEDTKILLKVHTSNYRITGFTENVSLDELASLGNEKNIVVMEDLGSGSFFDLSLIGLPYEPTVQDSIRNGADIVTFSGDKLLGGPQAGIIAGRKGLIDRIKSNPLMRILRCDKLTIAAMTAVLSLYLNPEKAVDNIPVLKMLSLKEDLLSKKAKELQDLIGESVGTLLSTEVIDVQDEAGGGSLPGVILKGKAVAVSSSEFSANYLQEQLRSFSTPVICRISDERVLLNVRTIDNSEFMEIAKALREAI